MRRALVGLLAIAASPSAAMAADPYVPPAPTLAPGPLPRAAAEPAFVAVTRPGGLYLGTVTAANFVERTRSRFDNLGASLVLRTDYEVAAYAAGRLGYAFDPMFNVIHPRVEIEAGYASNSVRNFRIGPFASPSRDSFGEARSIQGYGNLYVDIDTGTALTPYVGGGVGVANVNLRRQGTSGTGVFLDDSDTGFAYHLDAGVGIDVSRLWSSPIVAGTTVELGYRWTQVEDLRLRARDGSTVRTELGSNAVTLGTRRSF